MLLGIAIRTGSPLSLNLAEPVWKQLAGMSLTIADLSEVTSRRERTEKWDSLCVQCKAWWGSPAVWLRGIACPEIPTDS